MPTKKPTKKPAKKNSARKAILSKESVPVKVVNRKTGKTNEKATHDVAVANRFSRFLGELSNEILRDAKGAGATKKMREYLKSAEYSDHPTPRIRAAGRVAAKVVK